MDGHLNRFFVLCIGMEDLDQTTRVTFRGLRATNSYPTQVSMEPPSLPVHPLVAQVSSASIHC